MMAAQSQRKVLRRFASFLAGAPHAAAPAMSSPVVQHSVLAKKRRTGHHSPDTPLQARALLFGAGTTGTF